MSSPLRARASIGIAISIACLIVSLYDLTSVHGSATAIEPNVSLAVTVSAASFETPVAPNSIAAIFGVDLATATEVAATNPLPLVLAGTTVTVKDSLGVERTSSLFFVSAGQVNCLIPTDTSPGEAMVTVRAGNGAIGAGTVQVSSVAPGIFSANTDGRGAPAANLIRVLPDSSQIFESVVQGTYPSLTPKPIDLGPEGQTVFLVLYLTGLKGTPNTDGNAGNGSAENVRVLMGGLELTPAYAGVAPGFIALDQINLAVPRSLVGRGRVSLSVIALTFGTSNSVDVDIAALQGSQPPAVTGIVAASNVLARDQVTINGSGLSPNPNDNIVRIGGIEAEIDAASTTQLLVRVPFGAATGPVTLNTTGGQWTSPSTLPVRTSISGNVRDTKDQPIQGAKVSLLGSMSFVTTPSEGWFVLPDTPTGSAIAFKVDVPSSEPLPYPNPPLKMPVAAQRDNPYPASIYLQQASGPGVEVGGSGGFAGTQVALSGAPDAGPTISAGGITFTLPDAGVTAMFPDGGTRGTLVLDVVENSLTPAALPTGIFSSSIAQIAPFGVKLMPGGKLTFPNPDGFTAGSPVKLFRFDLTPASPTLGTFIDTGRQALVSADGSRIETEANAITETSYYFVSLARPLTTVLGRVLDSDGITPVRGAIVHARGQEASTDGNGGFVLRRVPTIGEQRIAVAASLLRPSGRIDRAAGLTSPPVINGLTRIADLILTAATSNRPPVISAPAILNVYIGETRTVPVSLRDLDIGQQIGGVTLTGASFAQLVPSDSSHYTLRVVPPPGSEGAYTLVISANDNAGGNVRYEIKLIVKPLPIAIAQSIATDEDTPLQVTLTGSDVENRPLSFTIRSQPANGRLTGTPPFVAYSPLLNFNGADSFTFSVNNGLASSAIATVLVNVRAVNDPPVLVVPGPQTTNAGQTVNFNVTATDPDAGQTISFTASNLPAGAQFNQTGPGTGNFTWTPTAAQVGTHVVTFNARDSFPAPLTDTRTVAITVNGEGVWTPTAGPDGGTITAFLQVGASLFAGTEGDGIFRTNNNGATWTSINQGLGNGFVRAFAVDSGGAIVAGTDGGAFRSIDNGNTWTGLNSGLPSFGVRALVLSLNTVFAGTDGGGIFRLNSATNSWTAVNTNLSNPTIRALVNVGEVLYAGTLGGGVFTSIQGQDWGVQPFNLGLPDLFVRALALRSAAGATVLVAGTQQGGVFQRILGQNNWTPLNAGLGNPSITALAVSGNLLFAGTRGGGVFRFDFTDARQTWLSANTGLANPMVRSLIAAGPMVFAGTQEGGVFRSLDSGANWSPANAFLLRARVTYLLSSGSMLFAGTNGGGVFGTGNSGVSWTALNSGLSNLVVSSLAVNGNNLFAGTVGGGVFVSTNNGATWTAANNGITDLSIQSLGLRGTTLFAGTDQGAVFRSADNGANWTPASAGLGNKPVYRIIELGGNLFAATRGDGVFRSANNGVLWTPVNNGLGSLNVGSFAVLGAVLFAGTLDGGVYRSTDSGANWTAVNNGLTRLDVYAVAVNGTAIFAGTKGGGVFVSTNLGANWTAINQGLLNPIVLALTGTGTSLFAGTDGGGVFVYGSGVFSLR